MSINIQVEVHSQQKPKAGKAHKISIKFKILNIAYDISWKN